MTSPFRQVVVPAGALGDLDAAVATAGGWDWQQALLWLYAAGAALVFLRLAWHLAHLVLIARRHPVVHRDGVRVVYVDEDCPPFSFFRTAFVHRPAEGDEQVLDQVVAHERTHIRQGHSLDILLIHVGGRRAVVQSVHLAVQALPPGASRIPRRPGSPCARLRPVHL